MTVKFFFALSYEMCIKTKFEKHFNQLYHIHYLNTMTSVAVCRTVQIGMKMSYMVTKRLLIMEENLNDNHMQGLLLTVRMFIVSIKYTRLRV